jgi:hypothetical protein
MTTDGRWARRIRATVLTLVFVVGAWTIIAVTAARLGKFETLMVIAPPAGFLSSLPRDIAFADGGRHVLVLRSDRPDFAAVLYMAGAALVLPAREMGCWAVLAR